MISIIVPCYRCVDSLLMCVNSIQNQTYSEFEILLIDDGSPDATGKLCDEFADSDSRIKVVHQENRGLVGAWKRGLQEARGEYIAFVDSDDWIESDMLEKMYSKAIQYQTDMVIGGMTLDYADGRKAYHDNTAKEGYYDRKAIEGDILPHFYHYTNKMESRAIIVSRCSKLIKKSLLMKNYDLFDESISYGEDDVTIFLSAISSKSLYCFNNYYPYHYCRNSESMIGKYDPDGYNKCLFLYQKLREVAAHYNYSYEKQITIHFMEKCMVIMKKEMHRNESDNLKCIAENIQKIAEADEVKQAFSVCREIIACYGLKERIFINLLEHRYYLFCVFSVRILNKIKMGAQ